MDIEEIRLTAEEISEEIERGKYTQYHYIRQGIDTPEKAIANTATDKAVEHYDKELRPYLEDVIEVLSNAQGEWYSVTKTYAPKWTHPYKEIEDLIDEALKKLVSQ